MGNKSRTVHIHHNKTDNTYQAFKNGKIIATTNTIPEMAEALDYASYNHDNGAKLKFQARIDSPKTFHCMQYNVVIPSERSIDYRKQLKEIQRQQYRNYKLSE